MTRPRRRFTLRVTSEISPVIEAHAAAVKRGDVDAMMATSPKTW